MDIQLSSKESTSSESKHSIIENSLRELENAIKTLETFVERVQGKNILIDKDSGKKQKPMSLAEFLQCTNDSILEYVKRIHEIHNGLRESLF